MSKFEIADAALSQNCVGGKAGFDFGVNSHILIVDWTVPNIVIALSVPHETATVCFQDFTNLFFKFRHYAYTF